MNPYVWSEHDHDSNLTCILMGESTVMVVIWITNFLHMLALEFLCRAYAFEALPS
jgi:hypothetical protein